MSDSNMASGRAADPTDRNPKTVSGKASIPDAALPPIRPLWMDQRRSQMRWECYNGPVVFDYPRVLRPEEIDDMTEVLALVLKGLRRTAQAIETQSAKTEGLGPKDESAVGKADAP